MRFLPAIPGAPERLAPLECFEHSLGRKIFQVRWEGLPAGLAHPALTVWVRAHCPGDGVRPTPAELHRALREEADTARVRHLRTLFFEESDHNEWYMVWMTERVPLYALVRAAHAARSTNQETIRAMNAHARWSLAGWAPEDRYTGAPDPREGLRHEPGGAKLWLGVHGAGLANARAAVGRSEARGEGSTAG